MTKFKVDIHSGVYLHVKTGELLVTELGAINNIPAVKTFGFNSENQEVEKITTLMNPAIEMLAMLIHQSEYLGEL